MAGDDESKADEKRIRELAAYCGWLVFYRVGDQWSHDREEAFGQWLGAAMAKRLDAAALTPETQEVTVKEYAVPPNAEAILNVIFGNGERGIMRVIASDSPLPIEPPPPGGA